MSGVELKPADICTQHKRHFLLIFARFCSFFLVLISFCQKLTFSLFSPHFCSFLLVSSHFLLAFRSLRWNLILVKLLSNPPFAKPKITFRPCLLKMVVTKPFKSIHFLAYVFVVRVKSGQWIRMNMTQFKPNDVISFLCIHAIGNECYVMKRKKHLSLEIMNQFSDSSELRWWNRPLGPE